MKDYWNGTIPITISDFDENKYSKYCDTGKYSYNEVSDLMKNEGYILPEALNKETQEKLIDDIMNGYDQTSGDFGYDIYGIDCYNHQSERLNLNDLSDESMKSILTDICNGYSDGLITRLEQSLDEKLAAASKHIDSKSQDKDKSIER